MPKQKKPSLRDLSKNIILDEHVSDIMHDLDHQSDRGSALIAVALVDTALIQVMSTRFVGFDNFQEIMIEREGAPLSSFFARIKIARALGVIGPVTESYLDSLRKIRNQFAHSAFKIDFENPLIAEEISKLIPNDENSGWKIEWTMQRRRYIGTCMVLVSAFNKRTDDHRSDKIDIWLP